MLFRSINQLRKESGLTINDKVIIYYDGLEELFERFGQEIKKATLASAIEKGQTAAMKEIAEGKVGIKKLEG